AALEQALRALRSGVTASVTAAPPFAAPEAAAATATATEGHIEPPPVDFAPTLPPVGVAAAPTTARPSARAPRSNPLAAIKQWFFGGNTIVKAGVGILFI